MTPQERREWTGRCYAAWLGISPEEFSNARGVKLYVNPARAQKIAGYPDPVPLFAAGMDNALLIACVPEWEKKVRACVAGKDMDGALKALEKLFGKRWNRGLFHWFDQLNEEIDVSEAAALTQEDYPPFQAFHMEGYGSREESLRTWLPEYFRKIVAQEKCFGIWQDGNLVSVADGPDMPYLPEIMAEPGIMTLPGYRRRGYAAAVCAAFLRRQLELGKVPVWGCAADNAASAALARKLGFQLFGRNYTVRGDVESFDLEG